MAHIQIKEQQLEKLSDKLLAEALKFQTPIDKLLSKFFRDNRQLGAKQRSFIAEKIYSTIRNMPSPIWLYNKLLQQMPKNELENFFEATKQQAPLDLRVNILKTNREIVLEKLKDIAPQKCNFSPYGIRTFNKTFLSKHPLFLEGHIEVQDESSQLAGLLLNPKRGDMVVDFCAGAGGKTLLLGMLMRNSGRIYAFDINQKRLSNLTPRLARSGLSNVYPQLINSENDIKIKRLHNKIDKVFIDAPCSGLGTLRRSPELKFRQTENDIIELTVKQKSILSSASKLLKVGGSMVYATCSILADENQMIIDDFLAKNPNFELVDISNFLDHPELITNNKYLQLLPHKQDTDGFFAALLRRIS